MNTATDKQVNFIAKLAKERVVAGDDQELVDNAECLSRPAASALIDRLLKAPKGAEKVFPAYHNEIQRGMYWTDKGDILRVYLGQQRNMNLVKRVVPDLMGYSYEYVGSANNLALGKTKLGTVELRPMELDEAKYWGKMTGTCIACGRRLDDPESVDAGIGPVCAKKF